MSYTDTVRLFQEVQKKLGPWLEMEAFLERWLAYSEYVEESIRLGQQWYGGLILPYLIYRSFVQRRMFPGNPPMIKGTK